MNTALTNPFTLLPAKARKIVYAVFTSVALVAAVVGVAYNSADVSFPTWLDIVNDVIAYLSIPVGVLAVSNMPTSPGEVIEAVESETKPDDLL